MDFEETPINGVYLVKTIHHVDPRGWFSESFNWKACEIKGLLNTVHQVNFAVSSAPGTFRGLHYQADPFGQTKSVFCSRGSFVDIMLDMRPDSKTYLHSYQALLSCDQPLGIYIPSGIAHGWYSLEKDSQIVYLVNGFWRQESERGVRYNDPAIGLTLPGPIKVIGERDETWPLIPRGQV